MPSAKTINPASLNKYISPTLDYKVETKNSFFGRNVQKMKNVSCMTGTKMVRVVGLLKGEGWNNNKTLAVKIIKITRDAQVLSNSLVQSIGSYDVSKHFDIYKKGGPAEIFEKELVPQKNKELTDVISLIRKVHIDKKLDSLVGFDFHLGCDFAAHETRFTNTTQVVADYLEFVQLDKRFQSLSETVSSTVRYLTKNENISRLSKLEALAQEAESLKIAMTESPHFEDDAVGEVNDLLDTINEWKEECKARAVRNFEIMKHVFPLKKAASEV